ncbi:fimbria/pilus outer membrane usher protein [Paraburkholderia lacunae]|nr:fimbria/pilus outer membrane usher protein [Paraburkholderia lacunae]
MCLLMCLLSFALSTRAAFSSIAPAPADPHPGTQADSIEFDAGALSKLGIDTSLARRFADAPRFLPGVVPVQISVNGRKKGRADARFDDNGRLCVSPALLRAAGLVVPPALRDDTPCYDYRSAFAQAVVTLHPEKAAIDFVVPTDALATATRRATDYATGGVAGLLNYDLLSMSARNPGGTSQYWQAATELGVNASGWIVRSRQIATSQDGRTRFDHQSAYAQRTFAAHETVLQAGQINPQSTPFAIGSLYGVQLFPEEALVAPPESGAVVSGIARTQARIEVRQLGALIYSSQLPPGPFALRALPLVSGNADLDVTIVEEDGDRQHFVVPAASFNRSGFGAVQGLSFAAGRLEGAGDGQTPWLATVSRGWQFGQRVNVSAGLLASAPYQAGAVSAEFAPLLGIQAATRLWLARATGGATGAQAAVSLNSAWEGNFNFYASVNQRTAGYRDLADAIQEDGQAAPSFRTQYSAGVNWNTSVLGYFTLGYTRTEQFGASNMQRVTGAWTRAFKRAAVSLNLAKSIGGGTPGGDQLYLSVNVPLGKRSVTTYANLSDGAARFGSRYADQFGRTGRYSVAADYDNARRTASARATLSAVPRYTQVGVTASTYGAASSSFTANLRGGVVGYGGGVVLSPYEVRDTFGVATIGKQPDIELSTPSGPVWTDPRGHAVLASLPAYSSARIMINTKTLPRNVDLKNSVQEVDVARGSVSQLDFSVQQTRRVLLTARLANGEPLPKLTTVIDSGDQFVAVAGEDGRLILEGAALSSSLRAELPDGTVCRLTYTLTDTPSKQARFYERADAQCVA